MAHWIQHAPHAVESLLMKYGLDGPRYPCYPSPENFGANGKGSLVLDALGERATAEAGRPLALVVHLPQTNGDAAAYLSDLDREGALVAQTLGQRAEVSQLHVAGGHAEFMSLDMLGRLILGLRRHFTFSVRGEYAVEIGAHKASTDLTRMLASMGINRLSVRARSRRRAGGTAGDEVLASAMAAARDERIEAVGVHLIYGTPEQRPDEFAAAIGGVVELRPESVSIGGFSAHATMRTPMLEVPDERTRAAMLARGIHGLTGAGYGYVGLGVFALADPDTDVVLERGAARREGARAVRPFPVNTRCDVIGIGAGAISCIGECCAQNHASLVAYHDAVAAGRLPVARQHLLGADDRLRRDVIFDLETRSTVPFSAIEYRYGIEFSRYFASELDALEAMQDDGLVELYEDAIEVTPLGRPLVRAVSAVFDRYLKRPETARYARG